MTPEALGFRVGRRFPKSEKVDISRRECTMNAQLKPREFPLPSSVKVISGTERAQAAYPYHIQFSKGDDGKFWFYNSMHFPEPMSAFDMVTAEAAYCALGPANPRLHCLPPTLGTAYRIIT